ncbi:synemin [Solea senegalensis]|uniref:Synemin n=1 Tax=Solea senegalensis TaxID=28829 RepID=A0AAV6SXD0_SOLSE|nr:synemin [Solea senegalensis]
MLPFRRTFESEKQHLQQLNSRLAQYLCRTKQLEQENAHLVAEINKLRQRRTTAGLEPKYKSEMRDLRRMVDQLSVEKSQAEVEREKLWRELQMIQCLCSEQTDVCTDISGELQGCAKELQVAHRTNTELQQRLLQLESEYGAMEEAHRQEMERARRQVESRVVPIITQTYCGPAVVPAEELQEYALGLSEGWVQTFELYQQKVVEMEQAMKADQAMLSDLQREKMQYAAQMDNLRKEAEKQGRLQMRLEDELMNMQETFRVDLSNYQTIVKQLEQERNLMAKTIAEKTQEHQHLLKVKMDLGMEVAAYRALLEGERVSLEDAHRRVNQHQRERIIDIKKPAQPYTPRASMLTTRQHTDVRYTQPAPSLTRSPIVSSGSRSPSKVIPISVADRARYQSPASRRDMISFSKARAAASAPVSTTTAASAKDEQTRKHETHMSPGVQKTSEERTVKIKQVSREESQISPIKSPTAETKSVRVLSPPTMSLSTDIETESQRELLDEMDHGYGVKFEDEWETESTSEQKILEPVSVEEIVEKVIRPAGLEARVCSPGESKVKYHVEKTEEENGTTKTQIVLESKVEEEVDFGEDSALDKLLSQGAKKMSLEDIEDTAAGSMIKNLFSDLQGAEILQNKSVNVQIIEEPVDSRSKYEVEVEEMSRSTQEPVDSHSKYEVEVKEMSRSTQEPVDSHSKYEVEAEEMSRSTQEPVDSHSKYEGEVKEMSRSTQEPVDFHSKFKGEVKEMSRSTQEPVDSHSKYKVEVEEMSRSTQEPGESHSKYEGEVKEMSRSTQEPGDSHSKYEGEVKEMSRSTYHQPSSTYFQIEELENVPYDTHMQLDDVTKSFTTDATESREYFVSTPDDNLSESEEGGGITSYGHYGMVDDLSDEKYYQDGNIPLNTAIQKRGDEYKFLSDLKDGFPECIIEEEICVSPVVQESVLEFLREDSLEPKEQLKGALEKLQSSVSGPLKEELAFLTKISRESPENMAVNVTKVQQSSDNGTMTIVAELNVSQTLEDSGLLEAEDDLSEEQIMAALRSSNHEFEKAFQVGAGGGYSFSIDKTEDIAHGEESEGFTDQGESTSEITERHIKFRPSEKSFTFQMGSHSGVSSQQELLSEISESPEKISQEKRVATIYLDSPNN